MSGGGTDDREDELRQLVAERVDAVRAKDIAPIAARQADDVITFNVLPPLQSRGANATTAQAWFDGYAGDIDYEVRDLTVTAGEDIGFCSFVYHVGGTLTSGHEVDMWVRATLCCRRSAGTWRIVHDHESVPFDPDTGMALISLQP